jgi:EmrB/QacA subfamily drug resistance transporter
VTRSAWIALGVITVAVFLTVLDISVVYVAFPSIERDLEASAQTLSWIVSGYSITLASLFLLAGRIADRVGRRQTFVGGLAGFLLGSFLAGVAPSVGFLIAARVIQASGGSFLMISGLSLVLPAFPLSRRSSVIGIVGIAGAIGGMVGPILGAVLVDLWSWRLIFLINPPIGILLLVVGGRYLPNPPGAGSRERLDAVGVPIGVSGVALLMLGTVQTEAWGLGDPRVVSLLIAGLALIPVAVLRSARHPYPLLELDLFRVRSLSVGAAGFFCFACGFIPSLLLHSLILQSLWGTSVATAGLALSPWPVLAALTSYPAGWLGDRIGHRWVCATGTLLLAIAQLYILIRLESDEAYWSVLFPALILGGVGSGLTVINFQAASLSDLVPSALAVGVATIRTVQQIGVAIGTAVVITILGDHELLEGYQQALIWPIIALSTSTLVMALLFPPGTAVHRLAEWTETSK